MDAVSIQTENPKTEQWQMLSQFTYQTNISSHFETHLEVPHSTDTCDYISGCVRQARAYFHSADSAPLDISPLLLYYGAVNLLSGTTALLTGEIPDINHHGLYLGDPNDSHHMIADLEMRISASTRGAFHVFMTNLSNNPIYSTDIWTLSEVLGSIPDLKREYEACYRSAQTYVIPLETINLQNRTIDRIDPIELSRYENPIDVFSRVDQFSNAYLQPQFSEEMTHIVLNPKVRSTHIGTYSIFGRKYLEIGHVKGNHIVTIPQSILMLMGLYALGQITRYKPEIWNPFVMADTTGERLIIERFLSICSRYLPNIALNHIHNSRIQFVYLSSE